MENLFEGFGDFNGLHDTFQDLNRRVSLVRRSKSGFWAHEFSHVPVRSCSGMSLHTPWAAGLQVGGTNLTSKGSTVAILAQGTSWAVATTQAFWAAVQIHLAGLKVSRFSRTVLARLCSRGGNFGGSFLKDLGILTISIMRLRI